jgi:hypothetical protein
MKLQADSISFVSTTYRGNVRAVSSRGRRIVERNGQPGSLSNVPPITDGVPALK